MLSINETVSPPVNAGKRLWIYVSEPLRLRDFFRRLGAHAEIVASAGDPELICFMRSSSKPFQALPLVRTRDDLAEDEIPE